MILNKLYQICNSAEEINFDKLPEKFVIKTTDGGNGDNVMIVRSKKELNVDLTIKAINSWQNKKYYLLSREWAYIGAKNSRIIIEELLEDPDSNSGSVDDYKFLCFGGKFKYLWIDNGRFYNHRRGFWDKELNFMPNVVSEHPTFDIPPQLPDNIHKMVEIAEFLATEFPFVRVDLYNIQGKIIFGEMTFYPWSGNVRFTPDEFDFTLGKEFQGIKLE